MVLKRKHQGEGFLPAFPLLLVFIIATIIAGGCSAIVSTPLVTPLPPGFVPTAAALTLEASGFKSPTPTTGITPSTSSPSPIPATHTLTFTAPASTPTTTTAITPAFTPPGELTIPVIPEARVQIYQLGELSRVTSPFPVIVRLTSRVGKVARVELFGEDGRLLARYVQTYQNLPWTAAKISIEMSFEINAAAELGRLVVSVEDEFGRLMDLNSVNLILLSSGYTELNPASTLYETILIEEPTEDSLILGGTVYVTGVARPSTDLPLRIMLIAEDGRVLGQRLAGVFVSKPGEYGHFFAEVPYSVEELTPVRLVVYEEGGYISDMIHLSSVLISLGP